MNIQGLPVSCFKTGDKVKVANPYLIFSSENELDDTFTVVETKQWKAAINDRTDRGYVMADGDYYLV